MPPTDEHWHRISGVPDFRSRLLRGSTILAWLVKSRSADEVTRIKGEARARFGDVEGRLDVEALANSGARNEAPMLEDGLVDY